MSSDAAFNLFDYFLGESRQSTIGDDTAIIYRGSRLSYRALRQRVYERIADLADHGIGAGDRVALLLYDSPEFVAWFLASAGIGAVSVPINTALSTDETQWIVRDSGARLVICDPELREKIAALAGDENALAIHVADRSRISPAELDLSVPSLLAATSGNSPGFILYTSGSTGTPKGALHCHAAVLETVRTYSDNLLKLTSADRLYSSSRLFFAYGLGNSLTFPLAAGASVILDDAKPAPQRIARLFAEAQPTVFFGVPAVYRALLDCDAREALDTSTLRLCVSAGEALPQRIFEEWRDAFGLEILDGLGSTEMLHIFISNRAGEARGGSSGRVVPGYDAKLLDDGGREGGANDRGNLWVRGPSTFLGYWNRPDLTAATNVAGWVKTGDLYRCDSEGFFYHTGRSDDCFKVSGLWVSPIEVESVLVTHPAVAEAAVVVTRDPGGLATGRAFVVIRTAGDAGQTVAELKKFAAARLPRYKVPSEFVVVEALPRTATGKVQRFKLRQLGAP